MVGLSEATLGTVAVVVSDVRTGDFELGISSLVAIGWLELEPSSLDFSVLVMVLSELVWVLISELDVDDGDSADTVGPSVAMASVEAVDVSTLLSFALVVAGASDVATVGELMSVAERFCSSAFVV